MSTANAATPAPLGGPARPPARDDRRRRARRPAARPSLRRRGHRGPHGRRGGRHPRRPAAHRRPRQPDHRPGPGAGRRLGRHPARADRVGRAPREPRPRAGDPEPLPRPARQARHGPGHDPPRTVPGPRLSRHRPAADRSDPARRTRPDPAYGTGHGRRPGGPGGREGTWGGGAVRPCPGGPVRRARVAVVRRSAGEGAAGRAGCREGHSAGDSRHVRNRLVARYVEPSPVRRVTCSRDLSLGHVSAPARSGPIPRVASVPVHRAPNGSRTDTRSDESRSRGDANGARRGTSLRSGDRTAGDSSPVATPTVGPGTPGADRIRSKRLRRMWHIHHDAERGPRTAPPASRVALPPSTARPAAMGRPATGARGRRHRDLPGQRRAPPRRRLSAPALP